MACPYCRKTVTAPRESTYYPETQTPIARPAAGVTAFDVVSDAPAMPYAMPPVERNLVAVWALVLSLSSLACVITGVIVMAPHADEMVPFAEMRQAGKSVAEVNQAFMEHFQGNPPGWLMGFALVMFMGLGLWVAGVVCGVIGARREPRRRLAIVALAISALIAFQAILGA